MRLMGWSAMRDEHVAQIGFRVEAVQLGGADQAVDRGGALATGIGAGEQVVLAAQSDTRRERSAALLSISMWPSST
jgi:hypothetical protein